MFVTHRGPNLFGSGHPYNTKAWSVGESVPLNSWSHVAITWQASEDEEGNPNRMRLYLNGNVVGNVLMDQVPWDSPVKMKVGNTGGVSPGEPFEGFQGKIADLSICASKLDSSAIMQDYSNAPAAVTDSTPPVIIVNGENPRVIPNGGPDYVDDGATASDDVDGDISSDVVVGGDFVNKNVDGD